MSRHPFVFAFSILLIVLAFLFRDNLSQFKNLGILGITLINFLSSATIFFPVPAIATVVAGGALYSPLTVAFFSSLGSAAGEIIGFLLGHSGKNLFYKNHHTMYVILKDSFHSYGAILIFIIAFIPNPFFDLIGIFAGIFHYPLLRFFIIIFIGRLVRNFILAYFGSTF